MYKEFLKSCLCASDYLDQPGNFSQEACRPIRHADHSESAKECRLPVPAVPGRAESISHPRRESSFSRIPDLLPHPSEPRWRPAIESTKNMRSILRSSHPTKAL